MQRYTHSWLLENVAPFHTPKPWYTSAIILENPLISGSLLSFLELVSDLREGEAEECLGGPHPPLALSTCLLPASVLFLRTFMLTAAHCGSAPRHQLHTYPSPMITLEYQLQRNLYDPGSTLWNFVPLPLSQCFIFIPASNFLWLP